MAASLRSMSAFLTRWSRPDRLVSCVVLTVCALVGALPAVAAQTGELGGVVLDEAGEPLSGVRVLLASPQMIGGTKEAVTDDSGEFRFPALDPGRYTVTLSAADRVGFEEKDIYVGIDARVDREYLLEPATEAAPGEQVIRVTAKRALVDVTRTAQGTSFTPEFTDRAATSRTYQGVALFAPGTVDGSDAPGNPSIHGGTPTSNLYLLDGLNITDPVTQTFSTNFNFDAIGELQIITGGMDAEYGSTTGGIMNIVTKSGGDEFELDGSVYWSPKELQLLDPGEINDSNEVNVNLSVGGPIIRKKLWFFLAGQFVDSVSTTPVSSSPFGADFRIPPNRFNAFYGLGKLKWQVTPWQKLSVLIQGDPTWIANERQEAFVHPDAERQRFQGGVKTVLTSETTLTDSLFWKSQIGYAGDQLYVFPMSCSGDFEACAADSVPGRSNQATGTFTINDDNLSDDRRYRLVASTSLSYFLDSLFGEHEFKAGIDASATWNTIRQTVPGGRFFNDNGVSVPGAQVDGVGDPFQVTVYGDPLEKTVTSNLVAVYLQDTWRPFRSLTLRPGLRFDSSRAYNDVADGGAEVFAFNTLSPRIGAAWDPLGDGKTVVRGGYYFYNETGLLTVPSFVGRGLEGQTYQFNPATNDYDIFVRSEGGAAAVVFRPGMVAPNMHEVVLGVQRQIFDDSAVAVDFTFRRRQNMFEDDESNVIWNDAGDNAVGFRSNDPRPIFSIGTPAEAMGQYVGVDFIYEKDLSDGWQAYVTYTLSQLQGTSEGHITDAFDNPTNREFEYGYLADDVRHRLRGTLTYDLPYGFQVGGTGIYQSGRPLRKLFFNQVYGDFVDKRAPSGFDPKDVDDPTDDVEFRTPDVLVLNARVAWRLKELTTQDIWLIADVFNILNTRPTDDFEERNLPTFGQALGRGGPMNAELAIRYQF
jgi:hypothetical protein